MNIFRAYAGSYKGRFIIALMLISAMLLIQYIGVGKYINLSFVMSNKETLGTFIASHYVLSVFLFLVLNIAIVACSIPLSVVLTIAAGYFFGALEATCYAVVGSTIGALIAFLVFRYLLRDGLKQRHGAALARFNKKFEEHGVSYLLFLQLLPITPFGFITVLAGLSNISALTFVWTTMIGILPGAAIYAFAGSELSHMTSARDVFSLPIIIALSLLAVLALLPIVLQRLKIIS